MAEKNDVIAVIEGAPAAGIFPVSNPHPTGRLYKPDFRDMDFMLDETRLRGIAVVQKPARARPWKIGVRRNQQGDTCVPNAYCGFRQAAPFFISDLGWTREDEARYYRLAQENDEFPGTNYSGTTARGMMKAAQQLHEVDSYLWVPVANGEEITQEYLLTRGTMLSGTDWPQSFFNPGKHGYVEPADTTRAALGHETLLRWYYKKSHAKYPDTYEFVNSWGNAWGDNGLFRMKADVFRWLMFQCNGDLVSPIETARVRAGQVQF